ncbi:DUF4340 domain-containing protein [Kiritimatiellota bacterium B12222]|nr:DUF4340 domain-containing protein [Kiritimatiellota bacterium B12222]
MKVSKTIFLFLVVLGLGAYIWFFEIHQLSTQEQQALERQAFDLPISFVSGIGIQTPSYQIDLFKTEQGWEMKHPKGARASTPSVEQMLARFKTLEKGEFITPADMRDREKTLADFGLSVPQLVVTLEANGQVREYHVGDPSPMENWVYVKEESSQNIMKISSDLLDVLPQDAFLFREKTLFPLNMQEIQALDLIGAETLRLENREGMWYFNKPIKTQADQEKVFQLLQKLLQARIDGAVNDPSQEQLTDFAKSEQVLRMWSANSKVPVEIVVGGNVPVEPDMVYARITGQEGLVKISKGMRNLSQTQVSSLRDRRLMTLDPATISSIQLQQDESLLRLEKVDDQWRVVEPVSMKASAIRIHNMVKTWTDARVEQFLDTDSGEASKIEVSFSAVNLEGKTERVDFSVLATGATPGRALVRKEGEEGLLQVVPDLVRFSPVDVLPYLSRQVLSYDPEQAVRMSVVNATQTMVVSRESPEATWKSQQDGQQIDQEILNELLEAFSTLTAQNLVELNPQELSTYGLDQPDLRISIGLGGEQPANRTLLVSQRKEDGRVMGILQGQNLVFELPAAWMSSLQNPVLSTE